MRKVPLSQEVKPGDDVRLLKAVTELLEEYGKDVGAGNLSAVEDNEGRRFLRFTLEVG